MQNDPIIIIITPPPPPPTVTLASEAPQKSDYEAAMDLIRVAEATGARVRIVREDPPPST